DDGADRVPIAFRAAQAERDGRRQVLHDVLQEPQLRTIAVLQKYFLTAIMIEIRKRERAPIFQQVQPYHTRDIGKRSITIVRVENISLVPAARAIGADQLVYRAPSLFVIVRRLSLVRRIPNHLTPE